MEIAKSVQILIFILSILGLKSQPEGPIGQLGPSNVGAVFSPRFSFKLARFIPGKPGNSICFVEFTDTSISTTSTPKTATSKSPIFIYIFITGFDLSVSGKWNFVSICGTYTAKVKDIMINIRYRKSTKKVVTCYVRYPSRFSVGFTSESSSKPTQCRNLLIQKLKSEIGREVCKKLRKLLNGNL